MNQRTPGHRLLLGLVLALQAQLTLADGLLPSISSRSQREQIARPAGVPSDQELEATAAVVGEIRIRAEEIFDTGRPEENTALFRLADDLHIKTRPATIASQLLFRSGDPYSHRVLEESGRILRDTRYLYDAQIVPVAYADGKVDVEVVTRDVWTLNPGISFGRKGGKNTSGFELEELNLLGLGTQLSLGFKSGVDRDSKTLLYKDRQLFGSWWGLTGQISENSDGRTRALAVEHPFYALDTHWAAGLSGGTDDRVDALYDLGKRTDEFRVQQKLATVYGGWSDGWRAGWTRRWTAGFTYDDRRFGRAPDSTISTFVPPDRRLAYPWIGWELIEDQFETTRNRDQIEKTEDFSLGWHARLQLGWAASSFGSERDALVFDSSLTKGLQLSPRQTLLWSTTATGRLESGDFRDSLLGVQGRYHFRQSPNRLFYLGLGADLSEHLDPDHQLLLGGDDGLRGYPLRYQSGRGRWLFTAEQRYFSNWYPFRLFHVGGAVFADVGGTWGAEPRSTPSLGVLKDVGIGLRLGNSRSALGNILHIDLAFPLDGDRSIDKVQVLVETRRSF